MAEVRLRLLRSSAQLQLVEHALPSDRAWEALLASFSMAPVVCNREAAACAFAGRKRTLWPSSIVRGQSMWAPGHVTLITTPGLRLYSQRNGRRNNNHNNKPLDSDVPLYMSRTGYYNILEVSGNATQAQIKAAYYKQSFRYHPDRNHGDVTATLRFAQVMEAYHILGSTSLRKKYDRGILSLQDVRTATKPSGKSGSPSRKETSGQTRASSDSSSVTKPMFDFDAFYQAHYGEQLERERQWKRRREQIEKLKREKGTGSHTNAMVNLVPVIMALPLVILYLLLKD